MVEMHVVSGYPYYWWEARNRMYYYAPPYNGGYATPWLWYDGDQHGSYTYSLWRSKIVARMNQPSPVTVTLWGDYNSANGNGTFNVQFRNDSTATINGRVIMVITEDSLYYLAPNGDAWHNHVARDYVPNQNGQTVTIAPGDSVTVTQSFTTSPSWDVNKCDIITWIQDDNMQPDSTKEIWQGGTIKVIELAVREEMSKTAIDRQVTPMPNPCVDGMKFSFNLPVGIAYQIDIFDVTGRRVRTLSGESNADQESVRWNRMDDAGSSVNAGVYFFRFKSNVINTSGKIVVR